MKTSAILFGAVALLVPCLANARTATAVSPDGRNQLTVSDDGGRITYSVTLDGRTMLEASPLGLVTDFADLTKNLRMTSDTIIKVSDCYSVPKIKHSAVRYDANQLRCRFEGAEGRRMTVVFNVSDNDVAFRYELPRPKDRGSVRIMSEATGYAFPEQTTTFLSPQSDPMTGWKRTKPSYEEPYTADAPMDTRSAYGHGYTFPALFRIGDDGWVLLSETDVDSRFCGSRLSDYEDGHYSIAYPMPGENNGNGTPEPAFALPGHTPWRTITVGRTLAPIVETTVMWDVVRPRYEAGADFAFGKGTWSWILWQDGSINFDDQKKYIDLAAAMGFRYVLIDNWWDKNIGRDRMKELIAYARSKGVDLFLWYSSSGYWNDISQSPINCMDNSIIRKREMKWLRESGVKGIKVDFFGGDKQETMRLYEDILSDANDNGLMVIFHGCTLPRGWERMYPNYVGSEAVLASENLIFEQKYCDAEAFNATLHPFIRNTSGCMEFGGTFLSKRLKRGNDGGTRRITTDDFELATAVLFQNPIQNFAITPDDLRTAPAYCLDFLRDIPTTWDETRFIDGYPGKYVVLARRHGDRWYIAAVNATDRPVTVRRDLPQLAGRTTTVCAGGAAKHARPTKKGKIDLTIAPNDGFVVVTE